MEEYSLKKHGDPLEKEFSKFIGQYFRTYESVWKIFIGNKGNNTKADIENYPSDRERKRHEFSEHTYTILQSLILLERLSKKEVFNKIDAKNVSEILDLQDSLLLFFAHLGRTRDNILSAAQCLLNIDLSGIETSLSEFYHKRNVIVHGQMLPIAFKANGEIIIPLLSKNSSDTLRWHDTEHIWTNFPSLPTERLTVTISQLYWELLSKTNNIFGTFEKVIKTELKTTKSKIRVQYSLSLTAYASGSTSALDEVVDVYGLGRFDPRYLK